MLKFKSSGLAMCASRTSFEGQVNTSDLVFFGFGSQVDCDLAYLAGISLNCKAEKIRIRMNSTTASVKHDANNLSLALQLRRFLRH